MIIKSYEIKKINLENNHFILFYGKNEGLKNEATNDLIQKKNSISNYDEKEILNNQDYFTSKIIQDQHQQKQLNTASSSLSCHN